MKSPLLTTKAPQNKRFLSMKNSLIYLFVFILTAFNSNAATFTSVSNGDWNSSSTWDRNGVPDVDNWPNDKVIISHAVTKTGGITMNGSTSIITINSGGALTLTGTLNVGSGQVHVNSGGSLSGNIIYLNTTSTCSLDGTITSNSTMHLDGHFTGSPNIVVGGNLLAGAKNNNQIFSALSLQVSGNMTVQNTKITWTSGTVTVGGNFVLKGTADVDVPGGGSLDIVGTLSIEDLLTIDGPSGPGSGGIVSWGVGNIILSGNNKGLNKCPLPYASPFDLSTCSQALGTDVTAPVITLIGNSTENVPFGAVYTDAGATAADDTDGNLTSSIVTTSNVDVNTVGSYTVTYNVSDLAGNVATEVVRTVDVIIDTDGDGIPDDVDLDDDNDGITDADEGCANGIAGLDPSLGFLFQGTPLSQLYSVNIQTGESTFIQTLGGYYNAVAYNEADGLFWGARLSSSGGGTIEIVRIDPATWTVVGTTGAVHPSNILSGAYDPVNKWYVARRVGSTHRILVYEADPSSANYGNLLSDKSYNVDNGGVPDIAYNAVDGLMYGVRSNTNTLRRYDIIAKTDVVVGDIEGLPNGSYGAIYSTNDGKFYFSNNNTGNIYLVSMAVNQLSASLFSAGPAAAQNDGAKSIGVSLDGTCQVDTDGDGLPDPIDLDSDGDGSSDAVEGGGDFDESDIDAEGRLTGGVDTNGLPLVAGPNGQGVGSQTDSLETCTQTFEDVAIVAGLGDIDDNWGLAWGDFNNDCYEDLFIASYDKTTPNLLYKNNGDGTFTKMTASAGDIVTKTGSYVAGTWGDYDNDGDLDMAISGNVETASEIYRNNGDETFTSITASSIGYESSYSHGVSFIDYDNDGYLDVFMTSYFSTGYNLLFRNSQSGSFVKNETSSITTDAATSVAAVWGDYDNDGDQDVYIANTGEEKNLLYRNDGNGEFTKITSGAIVNDESNSVGASWGDYNGDGYIDLFVTNANQNNALYTNNAGVDFTKVTTGVMVTDGGHSHGSAWVDYDSDGDLDLHVSNDQSTVDFLYENDGSGNFTRSTLLDEFTRNSMGLGWADYDNDGDLDIAVANRSGEANYLIQSTQTGSCSNNSLTLRLSGDGSGIGARVSAKATINASTYWQYRHVSGQTGGGVGGQSSLKVSFGFGDATMVDSLMIHWPNGLIQVLTDIDLTSVNTNCYSVTMPSKATVCGTAFYDLNQDCIKDPNESYVSNIQVQSDENDYVAATAGDGEYSFNAATGTYTLTMQDHPSWTMTPGCPTSHAVNAASVGESYCGNDFSLQAVCSYADLNGELTNTAQRAGFHNTISLLVTNAGGSEATGVTVTLTLDEDVSYISASPVPDAVVGNELSWDVSSMGVNEALRFEVIDSVNLSTPPGEKLTFHATMNSSGAMCDTSDTSLLDSCVSSFDPNDILLLNPGYGYKHVIDKGDHVSYRVRFQNVGNWYATNVLIIDTLPSEIDPITIRRTRSSHDYVWSVENGGILKVFYEGVELPDSTRDEPGSHGYFEFTASLKSDNLYDDNQVFNRASIFFDFNSPVTTNTVFNTVVDLYRLENSGELILVGFPNPAAEDINVGLVSYENVLMPIKLTRIEIYSNGQLVRSHTDGRLHDRELSKESPMNYESIQTDESEVEFYMSPKLDLLGLPVGDYVIVAWGRNGLIYTTRFMKD